MCLRFVFLLITRASSWLQLSRHEESWKTAEILILRHQLAVLQRQQPRRANLDWADRDQPPPPDAEELSPGELRVLRYLPTNLSRPEIAAELSVPVNTVSTHIRSIYAKFSADDRSAAVRCARELRLLLVNGPGRSETQTETSGLHRCRLGKAFACQAR